MKPGKGFFSVNIIPLGQLFGGMGGGDESWSLNMDHVVPCSFVIHHDGYNQTAAAASQLNCTVLCVEP